MAYFVTAVTPYSRAVYPEFLDDPRKNPFNDVRLLADPDSLELGWAERGFISEGRGNMGRGYPVDVTLAPKKLLWSGDKLALPEVLLNGFLCVSDRFRRLVEQFEPDVHQFIPVDVYRTKKGDSVATYYWVNVCNRKDCVDAERSGLE